MLVVTEIPTYHSQEKMFMLVVTEIPTFHSQGNIFMLVVTEISTYHFQENIFMLVVTKIPTLLFPWKIFQETALLLGVFRLRVELVILCFSCKETGSRDIINFFLQK